MRVPQGGIALLSSSWMPVIGPVTLLPKCADKANVVAVI
jgi:hypothetical protein